MMMTIFVNGRFRAHKITGVQRYAHEITARLPNLQVCEPRKKLQGWRGHLWEQTVLPLQARAGILWSPCAAGPLTARRHIVTFHDLFPIDSPQWYRREYAAWYRVSMQKLAHSATHVIAVSEYTKTRLIKRLSIPASKISVIHSGVVQPKTPAAGPEAAAKAAHSALNLPSSKYLLCVASLEPRKNLAALIKVWREIVNDLPSDLWLVVAGGGDKHVYRDSPLYDLPPRVFLTGYVPEEHMSGLYAGSTGFVYPSLGEGFGFPPLEAMAHGIPVITSNISSLPEVCASAAVYVNPLDPADIARGIKLLVSDPGLHRRLSAMGRDQAARFTWEQAAEKTLAVLRSTIQ